MAGAPAAAAFVSLEFTGRREAPPGRDLLRPRPWTMLAFFVLLGMTNLAKGLLFGTAMVLLPIGGYLLFAPTSDQCLQDTAFLKKVSSRLAPGAKVVVYVVTRRGKGADLERYGTATVIDSRKHSRGQKSPADRLVLVSTAI